MLEVRPVYHRGDARVQAHVFVAALTLLLDRVLEKSLRAGDSRLSTPFAWQTLEMIRCVEVDLGQRRKICVTRGNQHVAEVLRALGITPGICRVRHSLRRTGLPEMDGPYTASPHKEPASQR